MKRKKSKMEIVAPTALLMEPLPAPPLVRQSRFDRDPWQPGQTPANPLMRLNRPFNLKASPYGHGPLGVEKPTKRGDAHPENPKEGLLK